MNQIKNKIQNQLRFAAALLSLAFPFMAKANEVQSGLQIGGLQSLFVGGGISSSQSLPELIANVIRLMLIFAGSIAVVFVIIGGFWYVTSAGNEEQAEKGKNTLINAIIGIVIIILSYVIVNVIANLVSTPNGYGF